MIVIEFLHGALNSYFMLVMWLIPLIYAVMIARKRRVKWVLFLAMVCIPFIMYYVWAITDIWSTHESAVVFNRSAQLLSMGILVLFLAGLYEHR